MPLALAKSQVAPFMFGPSALRERPELVVEFARSLNGFSRDGVARAALGSGDDHGRVGEQDQGGAPLGRAALRVTLGGALAMLMTALIGRLVGGLVGGLAG